MSKRTSLDVTGTTGGKASSEVLQASGRAGPDNLVLKALLLNAADALRAPGWEGEVVAVTKAAARIASLESELEALRERLSEVERERDRYRGSDRSVAERMFDHRRSMTAAEARIDDILQSVTEVGECGEDGWDLGYEDWAFDDYDESMEIYGVADRVSDEQLHDVARRAGFDRIWIHRHPKESGEAWGCSAKCASHSLRASTSPEEPR